MTSFTITSSTAVTTTQTLSLPADTGFIGALASLVTGPETAVEIASSANSAFLVNNGAIVSSFRAVLASASFRLVNAGIVACEGNAIEQAISGSTQTSTIIQNSGSILSSAGTAIGLFESGAQITNDGLISGWESAIQIGAFGAFGVNVILNSGTITALEEIGGTAIQAANALRLVNTGEILGGIAGSAQADDIDTRTGTITGIVNLGEGDNVFRGSAGEDDAHSGAGNDLLKGYDGNDTLTSQGGDDFLFGGKDDDILQALGGANQLFGGLGDDALFCGAGRDALDGGGGSDTLVGGNGSDDLFGGSGADEFRYTAVGNSRTGGGADTVHDFERGSDIIDLSALEGTLAFAGQGPLTGPGTRSVAYTKFGGGVTVRVDADGDGTADMAITLLGVSQLTGADFLL